MGRVGARRARMDRLLSFCKDRLETLISIPNIYLLVLIVFKYME
jgi:hypothetical protein